jgi:hypothetical protein
MECIGRGTAIKTRSKVTATVRFEPYAATHVGVFKNKSTSAHAEGHLVKGAFI